MQFHIPTIGEIIILTRDWEFDLHSEHSNYSLWNVAFPNESASGRPTFYTKSIRLFGFRAGSILRVDKLYIKKNFGRFDSVTFVLQYDSSKEISKKPRFWVKLVDANKIVCDIYNPDADARIDSFECIGQFLVVHLKDGRTVRASFGKLGKELPFVSDQDRLNCKIIGSGTGLHWPDLDEDLSLAGLIRDFGTDK